MLGLGLAAGAPAAHAQPAVTDAAPVVPGANAFVSGLDLECYSTPGPALNVSVTLTHLNPVLLGLGLPPHQVFIHELAQTCVPVTKNNAQPQAAALPFIRQIDFACYTIETPALTTPPILTLSHLNPVLANQPVHKSTLVQATQLCLPVGKNNVALPPDPLRVAQFLDLECYATRPDAPPTFAVLLTQLNPQLVQAIPPHQLVVNSQQRPLCVPVQKNQQVIPTDVLNVVRWVDLEQFLAAPPVSIAPVTVVLNHLNPLFATLPAVTVVLRQAIGLMVPVAKNGAIPPP